MAPDKNKLYEFVGTDAEFHSEHPSAFGPVYFPLVNEAGLLSAITPDLKGDIKLDQHTFMTLPVSFDDLRNVGGGRNFWVRLESPSKKKSQHVVAWAVNGGSAFQRALAEGEETVTLEAGFLWQEITRTNEKLGLKASVLNFVPATGGTHEIMRIRLTNIGKKAITITGISAIPLFGRSADNLRDHRHVTSLLHRVKKVPFGIELCPTMSFNERGHEKNVTTYFVAGFDDEGKPPEGIFPTISSFIGDGGDLERPRAIFEHLKPATRVEESDQGQEAIGALQFKSETLKSKEVKDYVLMLGINRLDYAVIPPSRLFGRMGGWTRTIVGNIEHLLADTKDYWKMELSKIEFKTGDPSWNAWIKWVQLQPTLRKIYGCSFLPDFDYGKGGRGWRDLWQDCLALLLSNPRDVRDMIVKNFGGVRIDGSNATIIGGKRGHVEFIADRNNITRIWMDHGIWPYLTTKLYLDQTGDWDVLLEKACYFRDAQLRRAQKLDADWLAVTPEEAAKDASRCVLKTKDGSAYHGTLLEHVLVQTLVQFFNVGEHNIIRLEGADWNDGLDMAEERGESVAFTALYAGNLRSLAVLLQKAQEKARWRQVAVAKELLLLLDEGGEKINYDSVDVKRTRLTHYFEATEKGITGDQIELPIEKLAEDLLKKADWIEHHLNRQEWVKAGSEKWMNGYYDNDGKQVDGINEAGKVQMTLTGQVFPIMSGVVADRDVPSIVQAVDHHLFDKKLRGYRLNTDFGAEQPALGRAFSFAYGEKENGAIFSHMLVMYANALYQRGFAKEGFRAMQSLYSLAADSSNSKIFPGLPEYFNNEGQGRYHYLTGSASWMILTYLTQVFGVRGEYGDLLIHPKLDPAHFDKEGKASVRFPFGGAQVTVSVLNPKKVAYEASRIKSVSTSPELSIISQVEKSVLIPREAFSSQKHISIQIELEAAKPA